jgi:hypothetical protein
VPAATPPRRRRIVTVARWVPAACSAARAGAASRSLTVVTERRGRRTAREAIVSPATVIVARPVRTWRPELASCTVVVPRR